MNTREELKGMKEIRVATGKAIFERLGKRFPKHHGLQSECVRCIIQKEYRLFLAHHHLTDSPYDTAPSTET